jgi:hypothetical protein
MCTHRLAGGVLAALGLTVLGLQLALLYGWAEERAWMAAVGLPGTAVLSTLGAVSFSAGCLLAAAPGITVRHMRRAAAAIRRPPVG